MRCRFTLIWGKEGILCFFFDFKEKKHISVNLVNVKVKVETKKNRAVLQNMTMLRKPELAQYQVEISVTIQ